MAIFELMRGINIGSNRAPATVGIIVPGGFIRVGEDTDEELINSIQRGVQLKNDEYDRIDIYVKPSLQGKVLNELKSWGIVDLSKVSFIDEKNKTDKDSTFELIYKKTDKNVAEIE